VPRIIIIFWLGDVALVLARISSSLLPPSLAATLSSQIFTLFSPIFEERKLIIFLFKLLHLLKIQEKRIACIPHSSRSAACVLVDITNADL